jgi:hypothetical protein
MKLHVRNLFSLLILRVLFDKIRKIERKPWEIGVVGKEMEASCKMKIK